MSFLRISSSFVLAGMLLPAMFASRASADPISILHMDINAITITATSTAPSNPGSHTFSTGFTGDLTFSTNSHSSLFVDIDGDPFVGYTGQITAFTGDIQLTGGLLSGGSVAVTVQTGSGINALSDTYSYDIVAGSGDVTRSSIPIVYKALGYSLAGATNEGEFNGSAYNSLNGSDFGGVDVTNWVKDEPLLGDFFQFHYRPNATTGVDTSGDVELYVLAIAPSGGSFSSTPLPTSLLGGLAGMGMLGAYRWRRGRQMKQNY